MTYKYKNVSDQKLVIVGFGEVEAGAQISSDIQIENPNLQLVISEKKLLGIDPVTKPKRN